MRLTPKAIEEVIIEVAGEDVLKLVNILKNKKNVSGFKLADKLKQGVNIIRNMLYRLHDSDLVSFIRKKDKQKGWYIYYWTFNMKRVKFLLKSLKQQRLIRLNERLAREKETQFYICPNECMRLDFDQSMNFEFKCPECGEIINLEDNAEKIRKIEAEIKEIEYNLKEDETVKKKITAAPVKRTPVKKIRGKIKKPAIKKPSKNIKKRILNIKKKKRR